MNHTSDAQHDADQAAMETLSPAEVTALYDSLVRQDLYVMRSSVQSEARRVENFGRFAMVVISVLLVLVLIFALASRISG